MKPTLLSTLIALALTTSVMGAINDACSVNGTPGVCLSTTTCSNGGGTSTAGYCPNDPSNVRCCTKKCGSGGTCRFESTCSTGNTATGLCPGPSNFKCCLPASGGGGNCTPKAINKKTLDLLKEFEGWAASPYKDVAGYPTVGYGHKCSKNDCSELGYKFPMTKAQGEELLAKDVKGFEKCISDYINDTIKLNDNQYGALVSWSFNVGCGAAKDSTLISRLNKGDSPNTVAGEELPRWNKAGGKVVDGLTNRRKKEVELFKTSSTVIAHPPC
ncbi:lysozyme [Coprinopsis cinerea okayama7|uniref:Lysozyme n=1 Tax=Coprinopsis cinerea (strain Okayama-7 / 130 / ATCC MYA-4618 / FGSC 9003) TaxID=240176 RepID=A8PEU5_COPC7|nr:lysozyme [Coprinopsis cinerea okayama7\|eukprot:XP_001840847.1 lysozyme [Coprinopsis cinerea okayama7\